MYMKKSNLKVLELHINVNVYSILSQNLCFYSM